MDKRWWYQGGLDLDVAREEARAAEVEEWTEGSEDGDEIRY